MQVWEEGQDELRRELQEATERSQRAEDALARAVAAYESSRQEIKQLRSGSQAMLQPNASKYLSPHPLPPPSKTLMAFVHDFRMELESKDFELLSLHATLANNPALHSTLLRSSPKEQKFPQDLAPGDALAFVDHQLKQTLSAFQKSTELCLMLCHAYHSNTNGKIAEGIRGRIGFTSSCADQVL